MADTAVTAFLERVRADGAAPALHVLAVGGEPQRDGATDTAGSSGHDGNPALVGRHGVL